MSKASKNKTETPEEMRTIQITFGEESRGKSHSFSRRKGEEKALWLSSLRGETKHEVSPARKPPGERELLLVLHNFPEKKNENSQRRPRARHPGGLEKKESKWEQRRGKRLSWRGRRGN